MFLLVELRQTFARLLSMVVYDQSVLSPASYVDNSIRQVIHKPSNFMIPPPLCNVILPNQGNTVSFSRNMLAEPTRLALKSSSGILQTQGGPETIHYVAYAPEEMQDINDKSRLHKEIMKSEEITGIIPVYTNNKSSSEMVGINGPEISTPIINAIKTRNQAIARFRFGLSSTKLAVSSWRYFFRST